MNKFVAAFLDTIVSEYCVFLFIFIFIYFIWSYILHLFVRNLTIGRGMNHDFSNMCIWWIYCVFLIISSNKHARHTVFHHTCSCYNFFRVVINVQWTWYFIFNLCTHLNPLQNVLKFQWWSFAYSCFIPTLIVFDFVRLFSFSNQPNSSFSLFLIYQSL